MAVNRLESLVLYGNAGAGNAVTVSVRMDSKLAKCQTSDSMSHSRHPSHRIPRTGFNPDGRQNLEQDFAVMGAGRLRSLAGVLVRRSTAPAAVRAVLLKRPVKCGKPIAAWSMPQGGPLLTTRGNGSR
jgi:hypothetical protein